MSLGSYYVISKFSLNEGGFIIANIIIGVSQGIEIVKVVGQLDILFYLSKQIHFSRA